MTDRPHYRLTIVSRPSAVPEIIRLRAVLKRLLRDHDFRCVTAEQLPGPDATPAPGRASDDPDASKRHP